MGLEGPDMKANEGSIIERLDSLVHDFNCRTRYFSEDLTPGRARMFAMQHRLNTRYRNSVLKLRVATNCPHWDVRMAIIGACAEEIIADHKYGGGRPHWQILEDLGTEIGLGRRELQEAQPTPTTRMAWLAWEALMSNTHWLEGLIANTCAERSCVPGYGEGMIRELGWVGMERRRWGKLFGLDDDKLAFFKLHEEADVEHSDIGWNTIAKYAKELAMEDRVVEACRVNLTVWENYLNGIADAGDALDRARAA